MERDKEKVAVIKNWVAWEGLLLMKTFMQEEKGKCKTMKGFTSVLSSKFKPGHN